MNTAFIALSSLSALCDDCGRAARESESTPSLAQMQTDAFRAWVQQAGPGACLEYHRGLLSLDRSPESECSEERRRALSRVADLALAAADRGEVHLVQRRNGRFDFSYLAIRTAGAGTRSLGVPSRRPALRLPAAA
jgi:hypothetical protein